MKHKKNVIILLFSFCLFIYSLAMIQDKNLQVFAQSDKPKIVCYFSITEDWTKNIVGDTCEVESLVSGQQDIHSYDPSADTNLKMDGADLYVMLGIGIEAYAQDIANAFPEVPTVILRVDKATDPKNGVEPIIDPAWTFPDGTHPKNYHFWTSPRYAIKFCNRLADGIKTSIGTSQGPNLNALIDQNLKTYVNKLSTALGKLYDYRNMEPIKSMKVCPFHPAFFYFFEDLGIERVAVIEQQPGGTVSASHLESVNKIVDSSVIVIYHPQEEEGKILAEQVARENGANVTWLTPLLPINTPSELISIFGSQVDTYLEILDFNIYQLTHSSEAPSETIQGYSPLWINFLLIIGIIIIIFRLKRHVKRSKI